MALIESQKLPAGISHYKLALRSSNMKNAKTRENIFKKLKGLLRGYYRVDPPIWFLKKYYF